MVSCLLQPEIADNLKKLYVGNNYYLYMALVEFATDKLKNIAAICKNYIFDEATTLMIQLAYIEMLNKSINNDDLRRSYALRNAPSYQNNYQKNGLKPDRNDNSEVDRDSLANYISKEAADLIDIKVFVKKEISKLINDNNAASPRLDALNKMQEHLTLLLTDITVEINLYTNPNKKDLLDAFNNKTHVIHQTIKNNIHELGTDEKVIEDIRELLKAIQESETSYYQQFTLFACTRKANSSLQPRIHAARNLLDARIVTVKKFHESCHEVNEQSSQLAMR